MRKASSVRARPRPWPRLRLADDDAQLGEVARPRERTAADGEVAEHSAACPGEDDALDALLDIPDPGGDFVGVGDVAVEEDDVVLGELASEGADDLGVLFGHEAERDGTAAYFEGLARRVRDVLGHGSLSFTRPPITGWGPRLFPRLQAEPHLGRPLRG
jgi:hypothetical protein